MTETELLAELREPVEKLVHRHYENTKTWYPHEAVPFSAARDFNDANPWYAEDHEITDGVRSAIYVNLLTEDNLPHYTHTILNRSPANHPLNEWTRRWTAEEGRHSIIIREWVHATRALEPRALEDGRMVQVSGGMVPEPKTVTDMLAYTAFQELATNVAHRNTGRKLGKEFGGSKVMALVAGDEKLHYEFYRDAAVACLEIDPSQMVLSIWKQLRNFAMPGTGIPGFEDHSMAIAREGIFDARQYKDQVVVPVLNHFDLEHVEGLSEEAEKARTKIPRFVKTLGRIADMESRRFAQEKAAAKT